MTCFQISQIKQLNGKKFKFYDIIKQIENVEVFKFNGDKNIIRIIRDVATQTIMTINNTPQKEIRANEFGNYVEKIFREKMISYGYNCDKPKNKQGKYKSSGYPDCIWIHNEQIYYLEIKTCKAGSLSSTFRSFFYSPSASSKITLNAFHLLIAFETIGKSHLSGDVLITDLYDKDVTLKLEYNTNNKELYKTDKLL